MKKIGLLIVLFGLSCLPYLQAQTQNISGTVTDADGEGLPGVTIIVQGTTQGTITDFDGTYSLSVPENANLVFSFIGFKEEVVNTANQTEINLVMREDAEELGEVIVIGYGIQKKKVNTGAISSISSEEISSTSVVSADQALQGRAAGVQVLNQSGQPGERPSIRIRGVGTNGNSDPLILVDGIQVLSIDNINPADIESMEVLKDAASASIYGARAANGVILITTKSGSTKGRASITYDGYVGAQNSASRVDLLNADEYVQIMGAAGARNLAGIPIDPNMIPSTDTDWQDELFTQNAPIQSHYIGVEGGNEKTLYSGSLSYFDQEGIIGGDRSKFERYNARLKSNTNINEKVRWGNTISFTHLETRGVTSNGSFNSAFGSALNLDPLTPVFETDAGVLAQSPYATEPVVRDENGAFYGISENVSGEVTNPLARLELQTQEVVKDQVLGNVFLEVEPIKDLIIRTTGGMDLSYLGFDSYRPLFFLTSTFNNPVETSVSKEFQRAWNLQWENTINYSKSFGKHNFNLLVGNSVLDNQWENLSAGGQGINTDNQNLIFLNNVTVDSTRTGGGGANRVTRASVFSRLLYDYNDRVSFSITQRRDGSSNFGSNNKFGNFWAFGASWVINEEPFFPEWKALSFLKLRASWGQNGNDRIGSFQFASLVDNAPSYGLLQGAIPLSLENPDLRWESSNQLDLGIESRFFDDKLLIDVDYYNKVTDDLLQIQELRSTSGFAQAPLTNVGQVKNEGVEMALEWRERKGKLFYSVAVNAAYNENTMTRVANDAGFIAGANWALAGEVTRIIQGQPIVSFFGYETDGIFQSEAEVNQYVSANSSDAFRRIQPNAIPGDLRFVDTNGDGAITDADRVAIGSPLPDWTVGSTLSAEYAGFDFSALLTGQFGVDVFNGITRQDITTTNKQAWLLNQWSETNTDTDVPIFTVGDPNGNYTRATDAVNIEDGSYVRLKNIQLGYSLAPNVLERIKCSKWRWYISVENLTTFTNYRGSDPEVGSTQTNGNINIVDTGIDRGIYPQARTFRLGTSITF